MTKIQGAFIAGFLSLAFLASSHSQTTNGLVAYYPLEGNVNDASGHDLNGAAHNGVSYASHLSGLAAHLSGESQYISLPATIPNSADLTVAFWVKTGASTPNTFPWGLFLVSRDIAFPNYDWNICIAQGRKIEFHTGTPGNDSFILTTPNDLASNEWVHVVCVANSAGTSKQVYLNGQLAASTSWTPHAFANSGVPIFLGSATAGQELHPYLPGDMDEVRIYNRPLSADEVQTLYNSDGPVTPPTSTPTNLVAHYHLEGNVNDSSGYDHNGTAYNGVTYAPHLSGQAAHLSGESQYISLPETIPNSPDLTVTFWVKTSAASPNTFPWGLFLVSRDIAFPNYDWNIGIGQGRKIEFHTGTPGDDSFILTTPNDLASNEWVHVACVANSAGTSKQVYLNGQLAASTSWTPHAFENSGVPIFLGSATAGQELHPYLPGNMDEVRIYNRALPANEIQAVYQSNTTVTAPTNGLLAYYPLDGDVNDASGNNQNGTAYNGVTYVPHLPGLAAHLSGESQYISLPETIPSGTDLTVAFWLKTSASSPNTFPWGLFLVSRDIAFPNYDWNICIGQGRKIEFHTGTPFDDSFILTTPNDLASNEWVHIVCVANSAGTSKQVYLDGQLAASTSWTPHAFENGGVPIFLGSATAGQELHPYLPGDMDEVRIYNRPLSADEVQTIYNNDLAAIPPSIITQPASQTLNAGTDAIFTVLASGAPPLSFQWSFNETNIVGATSNTLTLSSVQSVNAGEYTVVVSSDLGFETSATANLRVNNPPVADAGATIPLVLSPNGINATVVLDGSHSFDLDGDLLDYQWLPAGSIVPVATGVVAIVTLPVGTNLISLTVSDGMAAGTNAITVEVITSAGAVDRLVGVVQSDVTRSAPLIATLSAAIASIDRSNPAVAIHQLEAFQNQIRAQLEPLDFGLAQTLIQKAQEVIDLLSHETGGTTSSGPKPARLERLVRKTTGKVHMEFSTATGNVHLVEASTNMVDWELIGVAVARGDGKFEFEDASAARFERRFYRIVSP